jgi:hypothetical protein
MINDLTLTTVYRIGLYRQGLWQRDEPVLKRNYFPINSYYHYTRISKRHADTRELSLMTSFRCKIWLNRLWDKLCIMSETSELILPDQTEFLQYKANTVKYYDCVYIFALHTRHSNRIRLRNVMLHNLYPVSQCRISCNYLINDTCFHIAFIFKFLP